jgi:hypothetical protein
MDNAEEETENRGEEGQQRIRILEDIPSFRDIDGRIYRVKKGDIVTLSEKVAEILCKYGVGEVSHQ